MFSNRVKIYNVYLLPRQSRVADTAEFIEEGFSFAAFFLNILWALYHRLWLVALAQVAWLAAVDLMLHRGWIVMPVAAALQFISYLYLGLEASNLRHRGLLKRGYVQSDVVAEDSELHAKQRYFTRHAGQLA